MLKFSFFFFILVLSVFLSRAQPVRINEVLSSNDGAFLDKNGDSSDWIELYNPGSGKVSLLGYGLSDKKDNLFKWIFPDLYLGGGEYLIVFASGKDLKDPPLYWNTVVSVGDIWKFQSPTSEPSSNWRNAGYNDSGWTSGKSGFGYGDNDDSTQIKTSTPSVFLRKSFNVDNPEFIRQIILNMDYDDGFVAYINGIEIARSNMTGKGDFPGFNALASGDHEALIYRKLSPEQFAVGNLSGIIKSGMNVLAVQVHNNSLSSSDLTAIPFLTMGSIAPFENPRRINFLIYPEGELHSNFKIDEAGESLYLTAPSGEMADSVNVVPLGINNSYGRIINSILKWGIYTTSTPEKENTGTVFSGESVGAPVFSLSGGIFSSGLKITISTANPSDSVYYTIDGSDPSLSSALAKDGITVSTSKVIKARILKYGLIPGKIITNSYIIYDCKNLPVVSISMNPEDLWNYNTGIYVLGPNAEAKNPYLGANFWQDWEKACHIELYDPTGNRQVDLDAGIKIHGNYSRANPQKSLAIHARKTYGPEIIKYKLFADRPFDEFKSIVLRNSGNDWYSTMFRDGLMSSLTIGMEMDQMAYRPAIIFLNGEYWGIQNIREKIDENFIASNNVGVDPDKVILLENNGKPLIGIADDWKTMISFVGSNTMTVEANYLKVASQLDISSFIDYYATQIFYNNGDWPGNNIRYWKTTDPASKWRYIIFDTDFGLGLNNKSPNFNALAAATATDGPAWPNPPWSTLLLRKLFENTGFKNQFVNRFADLMNSTLLPENINKAIDEKKNAIVNEIGLHLKRWSGASQSTWLSNVQFMKSYVTSRPYNVFVHIQEKFGFQLPQRINVLANASQGAVLLNSLKLKTFPWSGSYFQEVPISLTAIPNAGYRFVRWEGVGTNSTSTTLIVSPKLNMEIRAVFESDGSHYENVVINEISFNNDAQPDPGDWVEIYNKGAVDINLSGWKLTDSDSTHQFILPPNTWLKADDYLVISNNPDKIKSVFGEIRNLLGTFGFGLGNMTDAVKLYSAGNELIDEVNYSNVKPWKPFDLTQLWSLELINPGVDNDMGSNWELSINDGTPGRNNTPNIHNVTDELVQQDIPVALSQNYPNPFKDGTYIEFKMKSPGKYRFLILNLNGIVVRELADNDEFSTEHSLFWDGKDHAGRSVPSGVYLYKLETSGKSEMKRMIKM